MSKIFQMIKKDSVFSVKFFKWEFIRKSWQKKFRWFGNTENFQALIQTENQMKFRRNLRWESIKNHIYYGNCIIIYCTKVWYTAKQRINEGRFLKTFKLQICKKKSKLFLPLLPNIFKILTKLMSLKVCHLFAWWLFIISFIL